MFEQEKRSLRLARLFWTFILAAGGLAHFQLPEFFLQYMPDYLPAPEMLIGMTGLIEWMLAASLWRPALRNKVWLAIALLMTAYLPVHIFVITNHAAVSGPPFDIPLWLAWLRLPLQVLFVAWTWQLYRKNR